MEGELEWQINKSVLECNKYLLETKVNCDVSFKVGDDQETIKAHKFILSTRSPVFERMLNGSFCESETDPVIPDVSPAAFRTLLRYCYYECLNIKGDAALSLLYAATKYMLPILERAARKTLIEKLDSSMIWEVCKYANNVGDDDLYAGCIAYLKGNLSSSNILDIIKYAVTTGHKELNTYYRKHFKENLSEANILDVIKYVVSIGDEKLHATCRSYLKKHLSVSNIWDIYTYALDKGDSVVHQYCRGYFEGDVATVREALQSDEFPNIQHEVLLDVLHINDKVDNADVNYESEEVTGAERFNESLSRSSDSSSEFYDYEESIPADLDVNDMIKEATGVGFTAGISISEIELFKACSEWAEAECSRQKIDPTGANKGTVLGECLSLIRFPTMLLKDLLTVVYPTGILTQEGMVNLSQYIGKDPGAGCQVDFPSNKRQFVVRLPESRSWFRMFAFGHQRRSARSAEISKATVYVASEVRVMWTRLWMRQPGNYKVSVRDESSQTSWSTVRDTKHENHVGGDMGDILHYIDIEPPQVLEAGSRYSVTTEGKQNGTSINQQPGVEYVRVQEKSSPYREVEITRERSTVAIIYALTLSLI